MNFIDWAVSLVASPSVPNPNPPAPEIPQGMSWCSGKLCDTYRTYDVLPGHEATKAYGAVPDWAFCTFCGSLLDVDLEGDAA